MINSRELIPYTKKLSIIYAEDHKELGENTTNILKNFFKEVHYAVDGEEALSMYKSYYAKNSTYYDIVLSDIQMPNLDGVELTQKIYEINKSQTIIILSAFDKSNYLLPLINLGIEQFIKKPIDYQELLKVLLSTSKKITAINTPLSVTDVNLVKLDSTFTYDRKMNSLLNNSENIYLTKYEIIFMQLLTSDVGKIFSNEDIVRDYTSNNKHLDAQNIRKLLSKLRKKLPKNILESVYGIGYKIVPYFEKKQ